ncbi:MAG: uroporphyrinogen-III C-methyltransferase [Spirochaetes bacterium RBG_13_51_14]|nr:MAG: uroporphyrinogen-III C-methyltransferase [Spirochaetes bacterium RBG_13_51_14]
MNRKGKVYLVGAGPGDIGLLTLRAKDLLEQCDVLIYDNLVNERIVHTLTPAHCEKIYVGKSGASHTMEQDDINRLIAEKAVAGNMVVRLKGGDPYIFGRGGEEAVHLAERNITFEVVSGISSAYAVPTCAGIPVTNRGYSSSVAFITGHEDPAKLESDIRWDKIATGVQTLVFLMGVKNLPFIIDNLVKHGLDPSTPAAVIENGCQPIQRTVAGTLADISEKVTRDEIRPPSIIVVGRVVSLRETINWYETRPLFGKTILVTRSRDQASELSAKLAELGANVIETPVIKIMPVDDRSSIHECIRRIDSYDWILFTSTNGVSHFFSYLHGLGFDSRKLSPCRICAIGSATGSRLASFGIKPDLVPRKFVSREITRTLTDLNQVRGRSFLLPRADIAPKDLSEALILGGAKRVDDIAVYRTVEEDTRCMPELNDMLRGGKFDMVTFTSSSTVRNFEKLIRGAGVGRRDNIRCAAIGPVTAETAKELGYAVEVSAEEHTIDGLVAAILDYYKPSRLTIHHD